MRYRFFLLKFGRTILKFLRSLFDVGSTEEMVRKNLVFEDSFVRITASSKNEQSEVCVVIFAGIGNIDSGRVPVFQEEFFMQARVNKTVWIFDKTKSWGNRLNLEAIKEVVRSEARGKKIVCMGNSMGGFLAILFSGILEASKTIAFAPQWSVDPTKINEKRWAEFIHAIDKFTFSSLEGWWDPKCRYLVVFGNATEERHQLEHFEKLTLEVANVDLKVIEGVGHTVAQRLKKEGRLYQLIDEFL